MRGFKLGRMLAVVMFALGLGAAASVPVPIPPAHWPEHSFYRVQRIVLSNGTACKLTSKALRAGATVRLQQFQPKSRPLEVSVISKRPDLREAQWVESGVDDTPVMSFDVSDVTLVLHHFVDRPSAEDFIMKLAAKAKLGERLWVQTATFKDEVAVQGLLEALTDLQTCQDRA